MFTDSLVTPRRLEVLIDLLREYPRREWKRERLYHTLQPEGLLGAVSNRDPARATIAAASELGLVDEKGGAIQLATSAKENRPTRDIVLAALDREVLAKTDIEPWFALFYAFQLGLGAEGAQPRTADDWAKRFLTDALHGVPHPNPFNDTKHSGMMRWFPYAGLGWSDGRRTFQANPYERLLRALPRLFGPGKRLSGDEFMARLANLCPELDGGGLFSQVNASWEAHTKVCTLGLSHALVDLHLDGRLRLVGTVDSRGWSVQLASPPRTDFAGRIDFVELPGGNQ